MNGLIRVNAVDGVSLFNPAPLCLSNTTSFVSLTPPPLSRSLKWPGVKGHASPQREADQVDLAAGAEREPYLRRRRRGLWQKPR